MSTTTFIPQSTVIQATWLQDVNNLTYRTTVHTATDGQTLFSMPEYVQNGQTLVMINGLVQQLGTAYQELTSTAIQFFEGLSAGDVVTIRS